MTSFTEGYFTYRGAFAGNTSVTGYWSFCDVPDLDSSAWALCRVLACFICSMFCIVMTTPEAIGYIMGAAWTLSWAVATDVVVYVISYLARVHGGHVMPIDVLPTPQALAYNILIEVGAVICGTALAATMRYSPLISMGIPARRKAANFPGKVKWISTVTGWFDVLLYGVLMPVGFTALACYTTHFTVLYGSGTSAFRAPAFYVTFIMTPTTMLVGGLAIYTGLFHSALCEWVRSGGNDWTAVHDAVLANAKATWISAMAIVPFVGFMCTGKILPSQYGLYFQPLVFLGGAVAVVVVVRLAIDVAAVLRKARTRSKGSKSVPKTQGVK